jgi:hypothetical protein
MLRLTEAARLDVSRIDVGLSAAGGSPLHIAVVLSYPPCN